MNPDARQVAAQVARESYGRLLAFLAGRSKDLAAAEDALSEAFEAALTQWPSDGVPQRPEAWLMTAAKRRLADRGRRLSVRETSITHLSLLADELEAGMREGREIPDDRLHLLFACAHPAIDPAIRTPLMLQVVLGLDAARIANALLVAPATLGQRLVRAKARIRDAGIPIADVPAESLPERLEAVLEAIYAAFGTGWDAIDGTDPKARDLGDEAVFLSRLVVRLLPEQAEAKGLLALLLYSDARRHARRDDHGDYVPLSQQDPTRWDRDRIVEAEGVLLEAARAGKMGRFQLEAAIQSVHTQRAITGRTEWAAIVHLYSGLLSLAPTVGAFVARAAARLEADGPVPALSELDALVTSPVADYQPYWAVRAEVLARLDRLDEARAAAMRALGLTEDPAVRRWLQARFLTPATA